MLLGAELVLKAALLLLLSAKGKLRSREEVEDEYSMMAVRPESR